MKIWVDADGCPFEIKEMLIRTALRTKVVAIFVANKIISLPRSELLQSVLVEKGFDVADRYMVAHSNPGDLAISSDVPLSALLVAKGVPVITAQGTIMNEQSIAERLAVRNFLEEVRSSGVVTSGPKAFDGKTKQRFAAALDRELARLMRLDNNQSTV